MSDSFVGEIRMFAGNYEPNGWLICEGQLLAISEYSTLFMLIGTTYGGDGETTFALPDLRGRIPLHQGTGPGLSSYTIGEQGGVEAITLTVNQIPAHTHSLVAAGVPGNDTNPGANLLAESSLFNAYSHNAATSNLSPSAVGPAGGSQAHTNFQPYLCVNFIISLFGIYPSQT